MVNSSTNLFLAAKQLAGNNKDSNSWNSFAQYARAVSDAMKKIVFSLRLVLLYFYRLINKKSCSLFLYFILCILIYFLATPIKCLIQVFFNFFAILLLYDFRENAPGQQECDQAADMINKAINKIDQASLSAISNNLKPTTGSLKVSFSINYFFTIIS